MAQIARDEQLRTYATGAVRRLVRAGDSLAQRQAGRGPARGNVAPWSGNKDLDFHGTLGALWVWSRAESLIREPRFAGPIAAAWAFVEGHWRRFVPSSLGSSAGDEAGFDCAMVLRAAIAHRAAPTDNVRRMADPAARLVAAHLADREDVGSRGFHDMGFLAWSLLDYARAVNDRGSLNAGRRFVERAFGMKAPLPFAKEPASGDVLFDFSSTTATRVLAVLAAEGATPFVGAWLRERVAPLIPASFVARPLDENPWNACVAAAMGQAFIAGTDARFLAAHAALVEELAHRSNETDGGLGRAPGFPAETCATFYFGLALDGLLKA